jgi:transcriptional regulator with XRE-family HTH domain
MPQSRYINAIATDFGNLVSRLRLERGWSKADLARHSGMNVVYLGHVERGDNVPTLNTLFRLADTFGVDAADLVRELDRPRRERAAHSSKSKK